MTSEHVDIVMIWMVISGFCLIANFIGVTVLFQWFNHLSKRNKFSTNQKTKTL